MLPVQWQTKTNLFYKTVYKNVILKSLDFFINFTILHWRRFFLKELLLTENFQDNKDLVIYCVLFEKS